MPELTATAEKAATLRSFDQWMVDLDALQALRMRDPARALAQVLALRGTWVALTASQDALLQARCGLQAGTALLMLGRQNEARTALMDLQALLKSPLLCGQQVDASVRHQAQRGAISCANACATLAHSKGDFGGALRAYQQALDLARLSGERPFEAHVLVNLANAYEEAGLPDESLAQSRQALALAQKLNMTELEGDIHHHIGNALAAIGQVEAGLQSNRRGLQVYEDLALPQKQGYALVAIAERLFELARLTEAEETLQLRAEFRGQFVNPQYEAYAAYLHGRIARAQGDGQAARRAFGQALQFTEGQLSDVVGQARAHLELARLELDEQHLDAARQHAQQSLVLLQGSQAERDLMQAHEVMSQVAKARQDLAEALAHHEAFHASHMRCFSAEAARRAALLAVRHEVDMARSDAHRQQVENARLTEALAAISVRLQADRMANAAAPTNRDASSVTTHPSAAQPQDLEGLGLTPREAEVLFWVTQGKTNDDVTQILGISISAVKKHLVRIFDKLGVENRTAAANAVRRRYSAS